MTAKSTARTFIRCRDCDWWKKTVWTTDVT